MTAPLEENANSAKKNFLPDSKPNASLSKTSMVCTVLNMRAMMSMVMVLFDTGAQKSTVKAQEHSHLGKVVGKTSRPTTFSTQFQTNLMSEIQFNMLVSCTVVQIRPFTVTSKQEPCKEVFFSFFIHVGSYTTPMHHAAAHNPRGS